MLKLIKDNIKTVILVLLVIISLYLILDKGNKEEFSDCKKSKFIFLYMDGCKYCDDLKKIWNTNGLPKEFQNKVNDDKNLKNKVRLLSYKNDSEEHDKRIDSVKESGGYPTLVLEKCNGKSRIYDGARNTESLLAWLRKNA